VAAELWKHKRNRVSPVSFDLVFRIKRDAVEIVAGVWDAASGLCADEQAVTVKYRAWKSVKSCNPYRVLTFVPEIPKDGILYLRDVPRGGGYTMTSVKLHEIIQYSDVLKTVRLENPFKTRRERRMNRHESGLLWYEAEPDGYDET